MLYGLSLATLWSPTGKGLTSWLSCVGWVFCVLLSFSCLVWYLIVSILDVSFHFYFVAVTCCSETTSSQGSAALLCVYVFVKLSFQDSNLGEIPSRRSAPAILLLSYTFAKFHFCDSGSRIHVFMKFHLWRGVRTPPPPEELQKLLGSLAILVRIPLKSQSYQSSIQCWTIIGTPAKRHLNGVSLAG